MIQYDNASTLLILCHMSGSVYLKAGKQAADAGIHALVFSFWRDDLEVFDTFNAFDFSRNDSSSTYGYQIFTFVLGFVVVFRCQMGYSRFWHGRVALETMSHNWLDAATKAIVFDAESSKPEADIKQFRLKLSSLFSLLHAASLAELQDLEQPMEVLEGYDKDIVDKIHSPYVEDPVFLIFTWIQREVTRRINEGGLKIPPPISTRIYQELTDGMQGFSDAMSIHSTPIPFPYAQMIAGSLLFLSLSSGFVLSGILPGFWAVILTTLVVGGYYALNRVSIELEDPFGCLQNDLPLLEYQSHFNNRLRQLTHLHELDCFPSPPPAEDSKGHQARQGPTVAKVPSARGSSETGCMLPSWDSTNEANHSDENKQKSSETNAVHKVDSGFDHSADDDALQFVIHWVPNVLGKKSAQRVNMRTFAIRN